MSRRATATPSPASKAIKKTRPDVIEELPAAKRSTHDACVPEIKLPSDSAPRCLSCGTHNSPEWRSSEYGPRTLCNACGLRIRRRRKAHKATRIKLNPAVLNGLNGASVNEEAGNRMSVDFLVS